MDVHPLRASYIMMVRKNYGQFLKGDKNPAFTEQAAMKITKMGLSYNAYMDVAIRLCDSFAKRNGWAYPYYNAVIGDKTINKVKSMINYTTDMDEGSDDTDLFESELGYAIDYIDWWFGRLENKPSREGTDTPVAIKSKVAEYVCRLHGVPYTSSNYNVICKAMENKDEL